MIDLIEKLKDAICTNDIDFLDKNKSKYDINLQLEDENNDTILSYAISDAGSETYDFFLRNNADVTILNDEEENIIHSIVYSGKADRLYKVINNKNKVNINHQSKDGTTPLLLSVTLEQYEVFNHLIKLGANVNIPDNDGNMPIHPACFLGYKEMVFKLVENGANLFIKTLKGNLPLALAVNGEHKEIVKYLYEKIYKQF